MKYVKLRDCHAPISNNNVTIASLLATKISAGCDCVMLVIMKSSIIHGNGTIVLVSLGLK